MLQLSHLEEPQPLMNDTFIKVITRDGQFDLLTSRVPCVGEHILIGDFNYIVKTVQHRPNASQVAAIVWVLGSPQPTTP